MIAKKNILSTLNYFFSSTGSIKDKILKSGFWIGLSSITLNILDFSRSIILARLLTPEIFGLMAICLVVIKGFEIFSETGFSAALIHRKKFNDAANTAFSFMIIRGFVLFILCFSISPLISTFYNEKILNLAVKVLSVSFILSGFQNIYIVKLQKNLNFKKITYIQQLKTLFNFILTIILACIYRNIWALVISFAATSLFETILSYVFIKEKAKFQINREILSELFYYGKFITGLSVIIFITTNIDDILIGKLLSSEALGYYIIAYTISNFPTTHISKITSSLLFPLYAKLQSNTLELSSYFLKIYRFVGSIVIAASLGLLIISSDLVKLLYGENWAPSIEPLQILIFFGLARALGSINGYLYNALGKPNITFYSNAIKLFVILIFIYPLTIRYGISGTAFSVTIPIVFQYFVELIIVSKLLNLKFFDIPYILLLNLVGSIGMMCIVLLVKYYFPEKCIYNLIFYVLAGIFAYLSINFFYLKNILSELIYLVSKGQ